MDDKHNQRVGGFGEAGPQSAAQKTLLPTGIAPSGPPDDGSVMSDSDDSFDWIGNEKMEEAEEEEPDSEMTEIQNISQVTKPFLATRAKTFLHHLLLAVLAILILALLGGSIIKMPVIYNVSTDLWVLMLIIFVYFPLWISHGLRKLASVLRNSIKRSGIDYPARLEACSSSLSFAFASLIAAIFWKIYFPKDCFPATLASLELWEIEEGCLLDYIPHLLLFSFVAGISNAFNSLLMVSLKNSFQEKSYKEKLVENRFKIHIVERLAHAAKISRTVKKLSSTRSAEQAPIKEPMLLYELPFILFEKTLKLVKRASASIPYRRLQQSANASNINALDEYSTFRQELLVTIQKAGYESIATGYPRSDLEAKKMAKKIFLSLRTPENKHLTAADFSSIFTRRAIREDAFQMFDRDNNGSITRSEFRGSMVKIFKEQRNLLRSVASTGSVLSVLDAVCYGVISLGLFLFLLALMGVRVQNILGLTVSIMLSLNFILFDAANKTFHSLMFLFVLHPFDIGDRIIMGEELGYSDERVLTVTHINIQNTVFKRWNGTHTTVPNHVLASATIANLSKSNEQWERVEFTVSTPSDKAMDLEEETQGLAKLRKLIESFLKEHADDYHSSFELKAVIAADSGKANACSDSLKFSLKVQCRSILDSQKKWVRHARILCFVKNAVNDLGLQFSTPL